MTTTTLFGETFTDLDWAQYLAEAYLVAQQSPDPSTQNGAIIYSPEGRIVSCDCNRFPDGVEYLPERWERPLKYKIIEHAERNSVYWAAMHGRATLGSTMVVPWAACSDCARSIIQAGVKRLVRHKEASDRSPEFWWEEIAVADQLLKEAQIEVIDVSWDFAATSPYVDLTIRHSGNVWRP